MATTRQLRILDIFMDLYMGHSEPVSSALIAKTAGLKLNLKDSSIRAELAELEKEKYICKSYKTQGRIPTNKGYEYYLSHIIDEPNSKLNIQTRLDEILKKRDKGINWILKEAFDLIDNSTKSLIITKKSTDELRLEDIKIYNIGNNRGIIIAVASDGEVYNNEIEIKQANFENLEKIISIIASKVIGQKINQISEILPNLEKLIGIGVNEIEQKFQLAIKNIFNRMLDIDQVVSGTSKIIGSNYFQDLAKLEKLFEFVENQKIWEVLEKAHSIQANKNKISLEFEGIENISIIQREIKIGKNKTSIALVGSKGQNYKDVFIILEMIEKELKDG